MPFSVSNVNLPLKFKSTRNVKYLPNSFDNLLFRIALYGNVIFLSHTLKFIDYWEEKPRGVFNMLFFEMEKFILGLSL